VLDTCELLEHWLLAQTEKQMSFAPGFEVPQRLHSTATLDTESEEDPGVTASDTLALGPKEYSVSGSDDDGDGDGDGDGDDACHGDSDQMPTDNNTGDGSGMQPEYQYEDWENDEYWDKDERMAARQKIPPFPSIAQTEGCEYFSDEYTWDVHPDEIIESASGSSHLATDTEDLAMPYAIVNDVDLAPHDSLQLPRDLGVLEYLNTPFDPETANAALQIALQDLGFPTDSDQPYFVANEDYGCFHPELLGDDPPELFHSALEVITNAANWPAPSGPGEVIGIWLNGYPATLLDLSDEPPFPDPEDNPQPISRLYNSFNHLLSEHIVVRVTDEDINSVVDVIAISNAATDNLYSPHPTYELREASPTYMEEYLATLPVYSEDMDYPGPEYSYAPQDTQPFDLDALTWPYEGHDLASFSSSITGVPKNDTAVAVPVIVTRQVWTAQEPEFPEEYGDGSQYLVLDPAYDLNEWEEPIYQLPSFLPPGEIPTDRYSYIEPPPLESYARPVPKECWICASHGATQTFDLLPPRRVARTPPLVVIPRSPSPLSPLLPMPHLPPTLSQGSDGTEAPQDTIVTGITSLLGFISSAPQYMLGSDTSQHQHLHFA
jgi:hypothetical protein